MSKKSIEQEIKKALKEKELNQLAKHHFVLGVIQDKKHKGQDITNADLLQIHELGSKIRGIPARPVLQKTIDENQKMLRQEITVAVYKLLLNEWSYKQVLNHLDKIALKLEFEAKKMVYSGTGTFQPLSPYTIEAKKSSLPLIDTGEMIRSIVGKLVKKT